VRGVAGVWQWGMVKKPHYIDFITEKEEELAVKGK